jgi:hypothetical protein
VKPNNKIPPTLSLRAILFAALLSVKERKNQFTGKLTFKLHKKQPQEEKSAS